jgi:hypothetical protein
MTDPSSRLDDSDMLEYLDATDSDFILVNDTMIQVKKMPHMPHPQLLTLCLTVKSITYTHTRLKKHH